jgi:hypothetical protein
VKYIERPAKNSASAGSFVTVPPAARTRLAISSTFWTLGDDPDPGVDPGLAGMGFHKRLFCQPFNWK